MLAVDDAVLVMEERRHRGTPAAAWSDLGRVVATLHAVEGERYGWHADSAYGPVALPKAAPETCPEFWGERRLLASCYFGHGEADLAMLTLFDRPDARFFVAYPTEAGWGERGRVRCRRCLGAQQVGTPRKRAAGAGAWTYRLRITCPGSAP